MVLCLKALEFSYCKLWTSIQGLTYMSVDISRGTVFCVLVISFDFQPPKTIQSLQRLLIFEPPMVVIIGGYKVVLYY